jgi:hypothetical protein
MNSASCTSITTVLRGFTVALPSTSALSSACHWQWKVWCLQVLTSRIRPGGASPTVTMSNVVATPWRRTTWG